MEINWKKIERNRKESRQIRGKSLESANRSESAGSQDERAAAGAEWSAKNESQLGKRTRTGYR